MEKLNLEAIGQGYALLLVGPYHVELFYKAPVLLELVVNHFLLNVAITVFYMFV